VHYIVFTTKSGQLSLLVSSAVRREMSHLLGHQVSKAILYFYFVLLVILGCISYILKTHNSGVTCEHH
jgi:hypothetical protein